MPGGSIERIMVAGEPGGGEPAMRTKLEAAWGAKVTEAMGIGDISVSLWGECEEQHGMHFSGRGFVHFELIEPETGKSVPIEDGARGELVYTHLKHRGAPQLRFRSRDELADSLAAAGMVVDEVRDAPDRPGREFVFVARRPGVRDDPRRHAAGDP